MSLYYKGSKIWTRHAEEVSLWRKRDQYWKKQQRQGDESKVPHWKTNKD